MAVVLITGCSSGIGLATARHFARLGDEVHAGVRHPSTAWELTAAIESDKLKIAPLTLDVDDDASVRRGVQEVIARSGRIDVLVNNAGIGGGGPIEDVYFIEQGLASVLTNMSNGTTIEVGMIGVEGMIGVTALLGAATSEPFA